MNKTLRAFPALIMSLVPSSLSFADDTKESVGCAYDVIPKDLRNDGVLFVDHSQAGRSGHLGYALVEYEGRGHFVLYSSGNDLVWDDGIYLRRREAGTGAYSNSMVIGSVNPHKRRRLLRQASHAYDKNKTNVPHWRIGTTRTHIHFGKLRIAP